MSNCNYCSIEFKAKLATKGLFCSLSCYHKSMVGKSHSHKTMNGKTAWNKGKGSYLSRGYSVIPTGTKHIREHIMVVESFIGRKLNKNEVVHHCDKNKVNNSIDNLQLFRSQSAHKRLHHFANKNNIVMQSLRFEQPWLEKANN